MSLLASWLLDPAVLSLRHDTGTRADTTRSRNTRVKITRCRRESEYRKSRRDILIAREKWYCADTRVARRLEIEWKYVEKWTPACFLDSCDCGVGDKWQRATADGRWGGGGLRGELLYSSCLCLVRRARVLFLSSVIFYVKDFLDSWDIPERILALINTRFSPIKLYLHDYQRRRVRKAIRHT